ncbi:MAG: hypothetical protein RQ736_06890 [Thiogranum sp.]|nr:hypothetical protein [Thiogranum sp.]
MRKLFVEEGFLGKTLKRLAQLIEKWWAKHFVIPSLTVVPAAAITYHIKDAVAISKQGHEESLLVTIHAYSADYPLLIIVSIALYLIIWNAIIAFIASYNKTEDGVDVEGLLTLFAVFEKIVGAKAKRFGACTRSIAKTDPSNASETFKTITQPDQQIALLANGLHAFFDSIDNEGVSFKVTIAVVEDNMPVDWFYFYPDSEPPRTAIESIQDPGSSISYCLERKRLVVIEDCEKEAAKGEDRHYVPRLADEDEECSLICYPIIHHYTHTIPYVVTVVADKREYFKSSKRQFYTWIFNHFALRIGLEHSLLLIKAQECASEIKNSSER